MFDRWTQAVVWDVEIDERASHEDSGGMDLLVESPTRTQCPYKGTARYWSARIGGTTVSDIAWSYEEPLPECPRIAGRISFYSEKLEQLRVDGRAIPA